MSWKALLLLLILLILLHAHTHRLMPRPKLTAKTHFRVGSQSVVFCRNTHILHQYDECTAAYNACQHMLHALGRQHLSSDIPSSS